MLLKLCYLAAICISVFALAEITHDFIFMPTSTFFITNLVLNIALFLLFMLLLLVSIKSLNNLDKKPTNWYDDVHTMD